MSCDGQHLIQSVLQTHYTPDQDKAATEDERINGARLLAALQSSVSLLFIVWWQSLNVLTDAQDHK